MRNETLSCNEILLCVDVLKLVELDKLSDCDKDWLSERDCASAVLTLSAGIVAVVFVTNVSAVFSLVVPALSAFTVSADAEPLSSN
ncbi:hypothetical protein GCM10025879_16400 [Leuconostoc litchii]|nr:hypothetical protein GCM10025879_16400 [Leuconostoc litchii]